jgi:hypothetical protein
MMADCSLMQMSGRLFAWLFAKKERALALLSTLKDLQLWSPLE